MTQAAFPEPLPREQMRAADADRQHVVDALRRSHDEGRLTLAEFDERSAAAYAARTYADLAVLTVDLPPEQRPLAVRADTAPAPAARTSPAIATGSAPAAKDGSAPLVWRVVGSAWFMATFINFVVWGIVSITTGDVVHPWWVWVGGPWGAVLLVGWLSGIGRRRADG